MRTVASIYTGDIDPDTCVALLILQRSIEDARDGDEQAALWLISVGQYLAGELYPTARAAVLRVVREIIIAGPHARQLELFEEEE